MKWLEQNRNPSILLRGYNLEQYQSWLELARNRTVNLPTDLQREFIAESTKQPPNLVLDVFVSYSRADSDFARQLNEALQTQGKTTWFDQESIATGTDFQQEIYRGIEQSDNFLFIISPESVNSPYCADEVEYAKSLNKRFVTVLHRKVNSGELHPELAKVQWLDFDRYGGDFFANFSELVRTLDTDRNYIRSHTKWSQRALEWQEKNKSTDFLLRGSEFSLAEEWLKTAETEKKKPALTDLQREFIAQSQSAIEAVKQKEEEAQQQELNLVRELLEQEKIAVENERKVRKATQNIFAVTVGLLTIVAGIAVFAGMQWRQAEISQIESLRQSVQLKRRSNEQIEALLDSLRIAKLLKSGLLQLFKPYEELEKLRRTLPKEVYTVEELNRLEHRGRVMSLDFQSTPNGEMIVTKDSQGIAVWHLDGRLEKKYTESELNTIRQQSDGNLYQTLKQKYLLSFFTFSPDGKMLADFYEGKVNLWNSDWTLHKSFQAHNKPIMTVRFSPDSQMIATGSWESEAKLWKLDGTLYKTLQGHSESVNAIDFSSDGEIIASGSNDGTVKLWNRDGTLLKTLEGHQGEVWDVHISPDNQIIASASNDETVKLWNRDGNLLKTIEGHQDVVRAVRFSSDGKILASASDDGTVKLWRLRAKPLTILNHDTDEVYTVSFSPDGKTIATTRGHGYVTFWNRDGMKLETRRRHYGPITVLKFSPDGKLIVSAAGDRGVRLSEGDGSNSKLLEGHTGEITQKEVVAVSFSPDSEIFAIGDVTGKIEIWKRDGTLLKTIKGDQNVVWSLSFSPDGKVFASASSDGTVKLWNRNGSLEQTLLDNDSRLQVLGVAFSPDEDRDKQIIAVAISDGTVKLWNRDGTELKTFQAGEDLVRDVAFSPNGQLIATASDDKTVKLWNRDGTLHKTFYGHDHSVTTLAFSPDGNRIAAASQDKTAILWNLDLDLDIHGLSQYTCDLIGDYLTNNPNVEESDKHLCKGISSHK